MYRSPPIAGPRRQPRAKSTWPLAALACAALLIAPAIVWWLAPRRHPIDLPRSSKVVPAEATDSASPAPPLPRATTPRPKPTTAVSDVPATALPVAGVVLDPEGHPVKGAAIACSDRDKSLATTTDDDGRFSLAPEAAGCVAVARLASFIDSDPTPLASGGRNALRLNRRGSISGDVVDERGAPVASFLLAIESYQGSYSDGAPAGQARSIHDPSGAFAWEDLAPGRYVLTASAEGRPPARSRAVDVEVGRASSHVRITLARGAVLSGRVTDATTGKPIAGANVALDRQTNTRADAIKPAVTDERGEYTLDGAPAGPFSIRVAHDGYRARIVTGLVTRGSSALRHDVELNARTDGGPGEDFAGIGGYLGPATSGVAFVGLFPGGPAEKAGIRVGDVIRRIDGVDASTLTTADCMQSLRGPEGTRVTVQVERSGGRVDVTIERRSLTL